MPPFKKKPLRRPDNTPETRTPDEMHRRCGSAREIAAHRGFASRPAPALHSTLSPRAPLVVAARLFAIIRRRRQGALS